MIRSIVSIITVLILVSCGKVYREYESDSFSAMSWDHGQEIKFTPEINDTSISYNVKIGVRHVLGMNAEEINLRVRVISPDNKERIFPYSLQIRDNDGEYVSSCMGDLCDMEVIMQEGIEFTNPGVYEYYISHTHEGSKVMGIMELGLIVEEK